MKNREILLYLSVFVIDIVSKYIKQRADKTTALAYFIIGNYNCD